MAFNCTAGFLTRATEGITNTNNFTVLFAVKKMTAQATGNKFIYAIRTSNGSTGHSIYFPTTEGPRVEANNGAGYSSALTALPLTQWVWMALVGIDGTNLKLYMYINGAWESATVSQTAFNGPFSVWGPGPGDSTTGAFVAKYAEIREWNRVLTEAQLTTEISSTIPVATGIFSYKTGTGTSLSEALTGTSGPALTTTGTVSLDTDVPSFLASNIVRVLANVQLPSSLSTLAQTIENFSQVFNVNVTPGDPEAPVSNVSVNQTMDNFTQTVGVDVDLSDNDLESAPTILIGASAVSPVTLVGTGVITAVVTIYIDDVAQAETVEVDGDGVWSTSLDLSEGTYEIKVRQTLGTLVSPFSSTSTLVVIAVGTGGSRYRSGSGTGPRKAIRPAKISKMTSWPTK